MGQAKGNRVPLFAKVTPECLQALKDAADRAGISRAAVIEILARAAGQIQRQMVDLAPADHRGIRGQGRRKKAGLCSRCQRTGAVKDCPRCRRVPGGEP